MYEMISRFMESFGSKNLLVLDEGQHDALPFELLFGWSEVPEYDLQNARFLLGFGANFLEEGVSPVHGIRALSEMRGDGRGERGRFAFIDSRHSLTAASADTFLPIKPGTHGAVALGIAYVLIKERHYDTSFVEQYVDNFESWVDEQGQSHIGFKDFVVSRYYPERVARITGAPARKIVQLAREFGRNRPSLAMIGQQGWAGTNGLFNSLAVLTLNVLVGNIGKNGGLRIQRNVPYWHLPPVTRDEIAELGLSRPALHASTVAQADRFPLRNDPVWSFCENLPSTYLDTLFVYGANPAFDHPYAKRIRQALEKIPFVVSFAGILDETSEYADLILPDHGYLERWMDSGPIPGIKTAHASVAHPVVQPMFDTRHAGDVLIQLADQIGGGVAQAFPYADFLSTLQNRLQGIFASGRGAVISGSFEESWAQFLKERGWQNLVYESFGEFWHLLVTRGGWRDMVLEETQRSQVIRTPSGKVSLHLNQLSDRLNGAVRSVAAPVSQDDLQRKILNRWGIGEDRDAALLPHFEEPRFEGDEQVYPYYLVVFDVLSNRRGAGSASPLLQEMFGYYHRVYGDSWVELNPATAERHHIKPKDRVRISSTAGSISARAVFNEATEPYTVAIPFGLGHTSCGRYAEGVGVNPYEILVAVSDNLLGKPATLATRVKIERQKGG